LEQKLSEKEMEPPKQVDGAGTEKNKESETLNFNGGAGTAEKKYLKPDSQKGSVSQHCLRNFVQDTSFRN